MSNAGTATDPTAELIPLEELRRRVCRHVSLRTLWRWVIPGFRFRGRFYRLKVECRGGAWLSSEQAFREFAAQVVAALQRAVESERRLWRPRPA